MPRRHWSHALYSAASGLAYYGAKQLVNRGASAVSRYFSRDSRSTIEKRSNPRKMRRSSGFKRIPRYRMRSFAPFRGYRRRRRSFRKFGRRRTGFGAKFGIRSAVLRKTSRLNRANAVNDFRRFRERINLGTIAQTVTPASPYWSTTVLSLSSFTNLLAPQAALFDEFKLTNIQVVLDPQFPPEAFTNHAGNVFAPMQFAIVPLSGDVSPLAPANWDQVVNTPGVRIYNMSPSKRHVINFKSIQHELITMADSTVQKRLKRINWLDTTGGSTGGLNTIHAQFGVYIPAQGATSINGFIPRWQMSAYATGLFRGLKTLIPS